MNEMAQYAQTKRLIAVETPRTCIDFFAGGLFKLDKHELKEERGEYLLLTVAHIATDSSYFAGEGGNSGYTNHFICIPANVSYRPAPEHKKPTMRGPQTAIVTGPAGEEIYIDEYGRIKVQFIWDREGKKDENTSCYLVENDDTRVVDPDHIKITVKRAPLVT